MPSGASTEFAPAKVNLTLHVTGRRPDGYHLIDSLVVFPAIGDRLSVALADTLTLAVEGPFAAGLDPGPENLVLRAARLLTPGRGAALRLDKRLPVAAGVGGGSADAAATLRLLSRHWGVALPPAPELLALGADLPVCLAAHSARVTGIGETVAPVDLPGGWLVLCNPGTPLATAAVFARLAQPENAPMPPLPRLADTAALAAFIVAARNDLEAPARALAPAIGTVLTAIAATPGCLIARMSGSGATCFGLFATETAARNAAAEIAAAEPGWWVTAAAFGKRR